MSSSTDDLADKRAVQDRIRAQKEQAARSRTAGDLTAAARHSAKADALVSRALAKKP